MIRWLHRCLILLLLFSTACNLEGGNSQTPAGPALTAVGTVPVPATPAQSGFATAVPQATASMETTLPTTAAVTMVTGASPAAPTEAASTPTLDGPQLAFIKEGDIWLLDDPSGVPYQLTLAGDIESFAWSADGERLAAFNGKSICFFQRDGSVRSACLELGLNQTQAEIERRVLWSPDQRWIVLWNPANPQEAETIGWFIVALDTTNAMWRIQDPADWGAALAPEGDGGGFTGQPLFLPDSRLIGTLSHAELCDPSGCRYRLFEFKLDALQPEFIPLENEPENGWSGGRSLLLSADGRVLTNYGSFIQSCDDVQSKIDRYDMAAADRQTYALDDTTLQSLAFHPDEQSAILARAAACSPPGDTIWSQACGLASGPEILSMQRWNPATGGAEDLSPGVSPAWSPDGEWLAFQSCLVETDSNTWQPDAAEVPTLYLIDPSGKIIPVSSGAMHAWKP